MPVGVTPRQPAPHRSCAPNPVAQGRSPKTDQIPGPAVSATGPRRGPPGQTGILDEDCGQPSFGAAATTATDSPSWYRSRRIGRQPRRNGSTQTGQTLPVPAPDRFHNALTELPSTCSSPFPSAIGLEKTPNPTVLT